MADDLTVPTPDEPVTPIVQAASPALERHASSARPAVYTARFGIAYALLAAVVGLAVGGFVVLAGRSTEPAQQAWSGWKPPEQASSPVREVAEFLTNRYRLPSGKPLVAIIPSEKPTIQSGAQQISVETVAVQKRGVGTEPDYAVIPAEDSVSFQLCGLGQRCAIPEGEATVERGRLLHRQALELALYTFKYVDGAKSVMAFLPPRANQQVAYALFFRRQDLQRQLDKPLRKTLPMPGPLRPGQLTPAEEQTVGTLTRDRFFQYQFQQAPDGSAVLVLVPPS